MRKALVLVGIIILLGVLWSMPLYICGNLVLWLFHIPFRFTILQSFALCAFIYVIRSMFLKED